MCGRFYVDEGTAREIERVIRGVDLRMQKMRTGDYLPVTVCWYSDLPQPAEKSVIGRFCSGKFTGIGTYRNALGISAVSEERIADQRQSRDGAGTEDIS